MPGSADPKALYITLLGRLSPPEVVDSITRRSEQIASFPLSGRIVPEFETEQIREVIEGSYRIIYYIKPEQIDVLAVIHGSQQIM